MNSVISVINSRIEERGVTLVFLSKHTNIKTDLLSKTLNGNRKMKADEFVRLCLILELTLEDFEPLHKIAG